MEKNRKQTIKDVLESDDVFSECLRQEMTSPEYQQMREQADASGRHPSADMLHDYVLDELNEKAACRVRDHLLMCHPCTDEVLKLMRIEDELEKGMTERADEMPEACLEGKGSVIEAITSWMFQSRGLLFAGVAMAAVFFLTYLLIQPPQLSEMIENVYQTARMTFGTDSTDEIFSVPWEKTEPVLGFASPEEHHAASRAFGAGLWSGRKELISERHKASQETLPEFLSPKWQGDHTIKTDDWQQTSWNVYFWLGKWCFLMRAVCVSASETSPEFWEEQETIFKEIREKVDTAGEPERKMKTLKKVFQNIEHIFKDSNQHRFDKARRKELAFEIDYLTDELSPKSKM